MYFLNDTNFSLRAVATRWGIIRAINLLVTRHKDSVVSWITGAIYYFEIMITNAFLINL